MTTHQLDLGGSTLFHIDRSEAAEDFLAWLTALVSFALCLRCAEERRDDKRDVNSLSV